MIFYTNPVALYYELTASIDDHSDSEVSMKPKLSSSFYSCYLENTACKHEINPPTCSRVKRLTCSEEVIAVEVVPASAAVVQITNRRKPSRNDRSSVNSAWHLINVSWFEFKW